MKTPLTPQRRPWSVCSSHAIFQSDVNQIWPLLAEFKTLASLVPDVASCLVKGKGVGLTRELTFKDGKTVHEVLIVNHPNFIGFPTRCPTPRRSRGITIFAPSNCNRLALVRLIFSTLAISIPMERPRQRSKACYAIFITPSSRESAAS